MRRTLNHSEVASVQDVAEELERHAILARRWRDGTFFIIGVEREGVPGHTGECFHLAVYQLLMDGRAYRDIGERKSVMMSR